MAGTIDLVPTFVSLAGGDMPREPVIDGRDISGLLLGTSREPARAVHYYFKGTTLEAVRAGRWKLAITSQGAGMGKGAAVAEASMESPRLYDLEADLGETTDVAAEHPAVVDRLRGYVSPMQAELCGPQAPGRRPAGDVASPEFLYPVADAPAAGR
jgi:arylsulfatase A-like enzyme